MSNLPSSLESERALLSTLINNFNDVIEMVENEGLEPEDFYDVRNRTIFKKIVDLRSQGKAVDVSLLADELNSNNQLEKVGGINYLAELASNGYSSVVSFKHYIDIVRDRSDRRSLINIVEKILNNVDEETELVDLFDDAERKLLTVTHNRRGLTSFREGGEVAQAVIEELKQIRDNNGINDKAVSSGFLDLNNVLNGGFQPGDLVILAARPSVGKTAFALNLAYNAAKTFKRNTQNERYKVAMFSLEMPAEQLMRRILSLSSEVENNKLKTAQLTDDELSALYRSQQELNDLGIFIDDTSGIKVSEIFSKCRKLKEEEGLDMIIIDYLQLIHGNGRYNNDRQQEVSEISRSLKLLARELEVPVIALSQLSRSVEQRQDKVPQLSDLRESGSIEQDADIVMFLSREDYGVSDEEAKKELNNEVLLSIKKHRNGALKDLTMIFEKDHSKFYARSGI